jgi:hypothetical protein
LKFTRATDKRFLEAGWDQAWIVDDPDQQGPYAVAREPGAHCAHCGGAVLGWTVIDLSTATGMGVSWTHDAGEVDATEHACLLNAAWSEGYAANS